LGELRIGKERKFSLESFRGGGGITERGVKDVKGLGCGSHTSRKRSFVKKWGRGGGLAGLRGGEGGVQILNKLGGGAGKR